MTKKALIVVNKVLKHQEIRQGATNDMKKMCWMFGELGFHVTPFKDLKACEIKEELRNACSEICECFVFVISSHGQEVILNGTSNVYVQAVLGSDGLAVSVKDLFECMDNDVLKETPKLCFIQACRSKQQKQIPSGNDTEMIIKAKLPNLDEGVTALVCEPTMNYGDLTDQSDQTDGTTTQDNSTQSRTIHKCPWYDDSVFAMSKTVYSTDENEDDVVETSVQLKGIDNPFDLPDSDNEDVDDEIDPGEGDLNLLPELPVDENPVDCPKGFLVMYSVQPHKTSLRSPTHGSIMLHYMFANRNELNQDGNVLGFLTSVARAMANYTSKFNIENDMRNVIYEAKVKICGTIYHRLTANVILKPQMTRQMRAWIRQFRVFM